MWCSSGVCANSLDQVLQALAPFLAELKALAVESTYNWSWLVDGLLDAGVDVRLVNTAAIPCVGVARSALLRSNQVTQASSDPIQRQGPPARRANQGLEAHRANHVTCAADTGHMDARAEPFGRCAPTPSLAALAR